MPNGLEVAEPSFDEGKEYEVPPEEDRRAVPKFSRRRALAELATSGQCVEFNRNIVNRLWALMMGRGLVHPVDLHHSNNPPSHPEVLDALAEHFLATGFDVKALLRELALTRTYQRSSVPPENLDPNVRVETAYAVARLRPLSAEQLAMSMMEATGARAAARREAEQQLNETTASNDTAALQQGEDPQQMLDQKVDELLKEDKEEFIRVLSGSHSGVQDFQATVEQALFLSNSDSMRRLLEPRPETLMERLMTTDDPTAIADPLYLSVMSRPATPEESTEVVRYLENRKDDCQSALRELVWAMLTSIQFRFNH